MSRIRILSDQTINQIAAGEVIEQPASVIKELIENAIDAKADEIRITCIGGGLQRLIVSDNGMGMSPDDALLALERHATSKIVSIDDLMRIDSMGFRGEALASIAAISKLTLLTSNDGKTATQIEVHGGKLLRQNISSRTRGTSITIDHLFYNVPARKKFQNSSASNQRAIHRQLLLYSLAHPEISFQLLVGDREQLSTKTQTTIKDRVNEILGSHFSSRSFDVIYNEDQIRIHGIIGDSTEHRQNRSGQYLFINKRPIHCLPISYAVSDGYGTRLPTQRFPLFVLHIEMPSDLLDVNVHPQKSEVRLKDEQIVKNIMRQAVIQALGGTAFSRPTIEFDHPPTDFCFNETSIDIPLRHIEEREEPSFELPRSFEPIGMYSHYLILSAEHIPVLKEEGLAWIDLRAAKQRILFERLLIEDTSIEKQALLLPQTFSLSKIEVSLIEDHLEEFASLGFEVRALGEDGALCEAIPCFLEINEIESTIKELCSILSQKESTIKEERMKKLANCCLRSLENRTRVFSLEEAKSIVHDLLKTNSPLHCPRGNRAIAMMNTKEIKRIFTDEKI